MFIDGYVNYGVSGNEKEKIYTISASHPQAREYKEIVISLPKGCWVAEDSDKKLIIGWIDGKSYLADDIISTDGDDPIFRMFDGECRRRTDKLEWEYGSIK